MIVNDFWDTATWHNIPDLVVQRDGSSHSVPFLQTYGSTHGLDRWGHPTSEVLEETDGSLVQYYQRGVLEWHAHATCVPSGSYCMQRKLLWDCFGGGDCGSTDMGVEPGVINPNSGSLLGPWGHRVSNFDILGNCTGQLNLDGSCTGFADFFANLGGVETFGYPKTDARNDSFQPGTVYDKTATPNRVRQYFQAAVVEYHPENPPGFKVQLSLIGDSARNQQLYPNKAWMAFRSFRDAAPVSPGAGYEIERVIRGPRFVQGYVASFNHITQICSAINWRAPALPFCGISGSGHPDISGPPMPFVAVTQGEPILTGDVVRTRNGSPDYDFGVVVELATRGLNEVWGIAVGATGGLAGLGAGQDGANSFDIKQGSWGLVTQPGYIDQVDTPDLTINDNMTLFFINVQGAPGSTTTTVKVIEGQLRVSLRGAPTGSSVVVGANQQIAVSRGQLSPLTTAVLTPSESVRLPYLQSLKPYLGTKAPAPIPTPPSSVTIPSGTVIPSPTTAPTRTVTPTPTLTPTPTPTPTSTIALIQ